MSDSLAIVTAVIRTLPDHDDDKVQVSSRLKEDLALDSMDVVDLILALEERLKVKIDDRSVEDVKTVQDLINCVDKVARNG